MHPITRHPFIRTAGLLGLAFSLVLSFASPVLAQDKATLDLLVKKGLITQADADGVAKSAAMVVTAKNQAVHSLKIEGLLQVQYDYITTQNKALGGANPPATNQFFIRRAQLGAVADLGNGWGGELFMDFAATQAANSPNSGPQANGLIGQNLFQKAVITKKVDDYGIAAAGYQRVDFTQEELVYVANLKPIERSLATRYFDESYGNPTSRRLAFANRHTGLFWNGDVPQVEGLTYSMALTNGVQNTPISYGAVGGLNKFAGWGSVGYQNKIGAVAYKFGVAVGYSADGNSNNGPPAVLNQSNPIWGYNPYVTLDYGQFELSAEYLFAKVTNGRQNASGTVFSDAQPWGVTITPSFKVNDQWELVSRFTYLGTNGRGTNISDILRDAPNLTTSSNSTATFFDNAWAAYFGVNWYIVGTSVRLSAGYEYAQFLGRDTGGGTVQPFSGPRADANAIRTSLQIMF